MTTLQILRRSALHAFFAWCIVLAVWISLPSPGEPHAPGFYVEEVLN